MKVLIVDDETPIREWVQYSIERAADGRFEIAGAAKDGNEALKIALEKSVDVIITDIKMPGMDGITLMKQVLEVRPYTKFVILTNYAEFSYAREAVTYGAYKYLLKTELKGADIIYELGQIYDNIQSAIQNKEEDFYSNGFLDIFSCYQSSKNEESVVDFWIRHGLKRECCYAVLGLLRSDSEEQLTQLLDIRKHSNLKFLAPALQQEKIFIVFYHDTPQALEEQVEIFLKKYRQMESGILVMSRIEENITCIMKAISQAEQLLNYSFFEEKELLSFETVSSRFKLPRTEIRLKSRELTADIFHQDYQALSKKLREWFQYFQCVPWEDVQWGREACIKLAIMIDERCAVPGLEEKGPVLSSQKLHTISVCRKMCEDMLGEIYKGGLSYSQVIREALAYIHKNYKQDISLDDVAGHVYRSPDYFSRLFKAETGEKFSTYLMLYRLGKAKILLTDTEMKIYEVANEVGYTTPSYFSKIYRKYMGILPEDVRNRNSCTKSK